MVRERPGPCTCGEPGCTSASCGGQSTSGSPSRQSAMRGGAWPSARTLGLSVRVRCGRGGRGRALPTAGGAQGAAAAGDGCGDPVSVATAGEKTPERTPSAAVGESLARRTLAARSRSTSEACASSGLVASGVGDAIWSASKTSRITGILARSPLNSAPASLFAATAFSGWLPWWTEQKLSSRFRRLQRPLRMTNLHAAHNSATPEPQPQATPSAGAKTATGRRRRPMGAVAAPWPRGAPPRPTQEFSYECAFWWAAPLPGITTCPEGPLLHRSKAPSRRLLALRAPHVADHCQVSVLRTWRAPRAWPGPGDVAPV